VEYVWDMPANDSIVAFPDHITTVLKLPELRRLSAALFGLGLTGGWPLSEQPGFATAGIRLGNLNLEICAVDSAEIPLRDWLTFEPADLETLADDLESHGLAHDPFDEVKAGGRDIYTRVGLPALENGQTALQVCHTFFPTRTTGPVAPGNTAGIKQVRSVNIGVDAEHDAALTALLSPRSAKGRVEFSVGPVLAIDEADSLQVRGLTVETEDPDVATATLAEAGLVKTGNRKVQIGSLDIDLVR
jgi:hypothetical protein